MSKYHEKKEETRATELVENSELSERDKASIKFKGKKLTIEQRQRLTAGLVLAGMATFMTTFILIGFINNPIGFINYVGINQAALEIPLAWVIAVVIAICYIAYTARMIPIVRQNMFKFTGGLKWIGIYAAFSSGIVEELVFRQMLMDWLHANDIYVVLQVIISGVVFGIVHFSWTLFGGNLRIGVGSAISTTALGLLLALVYIVASRNILPAIMAHILINLFIEPWLILNAVKSTHEAEKNDVQQD